MIATDDIDLDAIEPDLTALSDAELTQVYVEAIRKAASIANAKIDDLLSITERPEVVGPALRELSALQHQRFPSYRFFHGFAADCIVDALEGTDPGFSTAFGPEGARAPEAQFEGSQRPGATKLQPGPVHQAGSSDHERAETLVK